ncbi:SDR family oxidoreductase [Cytophagaceae bacterium YF14B1]|uniref:SDR family oxidoreductase n=1 Tax=Xanthocytophaga flava TaxID=3048013 RepID=A0AAE3UA34_9BACT|nr:SDR family oxidoreductase [Xanthocytophaga flavus]MDJ1484307.1 SDR family oxidoreductase [Xanthocytophaga flavus]
MNSLKDKVVVITGGNSGIGYATAKAFSSVEANVLITGKRADALKKVTEETGIQSFLANQSVMADIDALTTEVKARYNKVDVLFLNAGIAFFSPIEYTSENEFDAIFDTNVKGTFFLLQKFIPLLNEGASVIILASGNTALNMPGSAAYTASKTALLHIAKIAAKELAPKQIRVNIVSPGPTETEMQSKFGMDEATLESVKTQILSQVPLQKMGTPEDVAKLVVYLSDNEVSSFITGSEFFIDGGMAL